MFDKLSGIEEKFRAIDQAMVDASDDYQKVAGLAQERAELEPIVSAYREYRSVLEQIAERRVADQLRGFGYGGVGASGTGRIGDTEGSAGRSS